jgi:hypothetical protein
VCITPELLYTFAPMHVETFQDRKGRPHVKRVVVVTAVPVFMTNGISINHTRDGIIAGLSTAIESGRFLSLAQVSNFY